LRARAARASFCAWVIFERSSFIAFILHHRCRESSHGDDVTVTQGERNKYVTSDVRITFVDSLHKFNLGAPHPLAKFVPLALRGACRRLGGFGVHPHPLPRPHKLRLCSLLPGKEA
jgi:hypothetical protein